MLFQGLAASPVMATTDEGQGCGRMDDPMPLTWITDDRGEPTGTLKLGTLDQEAEYVLSYRLVLSPAHQLTWVDPSRSPTLPGETLRLSLPDEAKMLDVQTHAAAQLIVSATAVRDGRPIGSPSGAPWVFIRWSKGLDQPPVFLSLAAIARDGAYDATTIPRVVQLDGYRETSGVPQAVLETGVEVVR